MTDSQRLQLLEQRLRRLRLAVVPAWQRSIQAVASAYLEAEITAIGRRLRRADWTAPGACRRPRAAC